jgi:cytochrome P450 family 4
MSGVLSKRIFTYYLRPSFIFHRHPIGKRQAELIRILQGFTNDVIVSRRAELNRKKKLGIEQKNNDDDIGAKKKMAFLDVLLESTINGEPLTNMDIQEEVDTFMFEGTYIKN